MTNIYYKKCSHCKLELPSDEYHKHPTTRDKLSHLCKYCEKIQKKRIYNENKAKSDPKPKTIREFHTATEKTCPMCKELKSADNFAVSKNQYSGLACYCKKCYLIRKKTIYKDRYDGRYGDKTKERYIKNREKLIEKAKEWRKNNKEKYNLISKKSKKRPIERIKQNLRKRLKALMGGRYTSDSSVGCTRKELTSYLESRFQKDMSWKNYGRGDKFWVVDHIKPLASFDLTDKEQRYQANHYTNLQPLWSLDNEMKSDNYDPDHPMGWHGLDKFLIERGEPTPWLVG